LRMPILSRSSASVNRIFYFLQKGALRHLLRCGQHGHRYLSR